MSSDCFEHHKYELVIFDFDGTLVDTSEGIINSANEALMILGHSECDADTLRMCIGPPLADSLVEKKIIKVDEHNSFNHIFRCVYEKDHLMEIALYDGIIDVLNYLRNAGIKTAIATNKPEKFTRKIIHNLEMENYFDVILGTDLVIKTKKEELIKRCLTLTQVESDETVMVGDTINDLIAAKRANVRFLGVKYGFGGNNRDLFVETPIELLNYI